MLLPLENSVRQFLLDMLGPDYKQARYLVGVSGGRDSMALVHILLKLVARHQIVLAHFNHQTRDEESARDEAFVEVFAKSHSLKLVQDCRRGPKTSELALRRERMRFLKESRKKEKADYILLAHHANDQLETWMMRLMRGTGIDGLKGIPAKNGRMLRPLLKETRATIESYVAGSDIAFVEDSSNANGRYLRNRVRHDLLPHFFDTASLYGAEQVFFRRFLETLSEIQWVAGELNEQTHFLYNVSVVETPYWYRLNESLYNHWEPEWKKRVLREILHALGSKSVVRKDIARIFEALEKKQKSLSVPSGIQLSYSCGYFFFQNGLQKKRSAQPLRVKKQKGMFEIPSLGLKIRVRPSLLENTEVRLNAPGDYRGATKLKRLFLEQRIPSFERKLLPVLVKTASKEVLWCFPEAEKDVLVEQNRFPFSFLS